MDKKYVYDIALSFSMNEKELVENVYHYLKAEGFSVFFAPAQECQEILSGKNQREIFYEIFGLKAKYVALFVSDSYVKRRVTMEECEIAITKHGFDGKVIPIYLDGTELPGRLLDPNNINYFSANSAIQIAVHIANKLNFKKENVMGRQIENTCKGSMYVKNNFAQKQVFAQNIEGDVVL